MAVLVVVTSVQAAFPGCQLSLQSNLVYIYLLVALSNKIQSTKLNSTFFVFACPEPSLVVKFPLLILVYHTLLAFLLHCVQAFGY